MIPCIKQSESDTESTSSETSRGESVSKSSPSYSRRESIGSWFGRRSGKSINQKEKNRTEMPSVGMRRTTRVFGVVKGVDGARVLRSGRRLWPEVDEVKRMKVHDGDDWYRQVKDNGGRGSNGDDNPVCKPNGWANREETSTEALGGQDDDHDGFEAREFERLENELSRDGLPIDRMFGIVYSRKRKAPDSGRSNFSGHSYDKRFGIRFSRRQKRSRIDKECRSRILVRSNVSNGCGGSRMAAVVLKVPLNCSWFATLFCSIVEYMRKTKMRLSELASFFSSQPINCVYSYHGVRFLRAFPPANTTGICKFFGTRSSVPLFSVDFSAMPVAFTYMHHTLYLSTICRPFVIVNKSIPLCSNDEITITSDIMDVCDSDDEIAIPGGSNSMKRVMLHPSVRASKLAVRSLPYRNGLSSRIQKRRRSSLRRSRNPSLGVFKVNGTLVSDLVSSRKSNIPLSSMVSKNNRMKGIQRNSTIASTETKSTMLGQSRDLDSLCCSANILVIEPDRCYREAVSVMLENTSSTEWILAIKKDGLTIYNLKAQEVMRPCSSNRFTHDIIWTLDDSWKLEFPNRQDWYVFKDLYKKCSDHNVSTSNDKVIPVPGIWEVSGYGVGDSCSFCLPVSYISVKDDEVARAMSAKCGIYDLDFEDQEWLKKFNLEFFSEANLCEHLSEDTFELMIDAFERAYYCTQEYSNEESVSNLFSFLGPREVVVAVYSYWMKKRKQKKSALIRVFQAHLGKKASLIPKPILRKKRSMKRQPSQSGRAKPPALLQALAAERTVMEEQEAMMLKSSEAMDSLSRCLEAAIEKRRRAQVLMENADLATYKATIAKRIAEAAQFVESIEGDDIYFSY